MCHNKKLATSHRLYSISNDFPVSHDYYYCAVASYCLVHTVLIINLSTSIIINVLLVIIHIADLL